MSKCADASSLTFHLQKKVIFMANTTITDITNGLNQFVNSVYPIVAPVITDKKAKKLSRELMWEQYQVWLSQLEAQNALNIENYENYTSPEATARAYARAGLGPAAMLGSVSFAPSVPTASGGSGAIPTPFSGNYGAVASQLLAARQAEAELDVKHALAENYRVDSSLKGEQAVFTGEQVRNQSYFRAQLSAQVGVLQSEQIMNSYKSGLLAVELENAPEKMALTLTKLGADIDSTRADISLKRAMKMEALAAVFEKVTKGAVNQADARRLMAVANLTSEQFKDLKYQVQARLKHGSYDEMARAQEILNNLHESQDWVNTVTAQNYESKVLSEVIRNYGATFYYGAGGIQKIVGTILQCIPQTSIPASLAASRSGGYDAYPSVPLVPGLGD